MGIHFRGRGQRDTEGRVPAARQRRYTTTPSQEKIYPPGERDERSKWDVRKKQWMPQLLHVYALSLYARRWNEEKEKFETWHMTASHVCATDEEAMDKAWEIAYEELPEEQGWEAHSVDALAITTAQINLVIQSYQQAGHTV